MYSREIDGVPRRFGVSGKLWHGVLVMFDRETGSYWTQLDGRAISGDAVGQRLEHIPSVFTTFGAWVDEHPDTLVLKKSESEKGQQESRYASYFADPDRLFLKHLSNGLDEIEGADPKSVVFGVRHNGDAVAVTEARMVRDGVVRTTCAGAAVALLRNAATGEVRAVLAGERVLEPVLPLGTTRGVEPTKKVRDQETGETIAISAFEELRVDRAFLYAWVRTVEGARVLTD